MMRYLYELSCVTKEFPGREVLRIERLQLAPGRLYLLTGANGAGKSTLLSLLAGLESQSSGELLFQGERVTGKRERERLRRRVTLLHQAPFLFQGTVADNVAYGLRLRGIPPDIREIRIVRALEQVGLRGFGPRCARELSGGESQRVALARALALEPEVLLLDEPLSNVDHETAELLERVIGALPGAGTTVVMTTHEQVLRLKGEVVRLVGGRIDGEPPEDEGSCPSSKKHGILYWLPSRRSA